LPSFLPANDGWHLLLPSSKSLGGAEPITMWIGRDLKLNATFNGASVVEDSRPH